MAAPASAAVGISFTAGHPDTIHLSVSAVNEKFNVENPAATPSACGRSTPPETSMRPRPSSAGGS